MVHQKWQIKAAIKQQQSQICTKVPETRHNKWGRITWGMAKRIRIIYSPSEAKWSLVFVGVALTLSNAVEQRRETDAREGVHSRSIAVVVPTYSICPCRAQRTLNSSKFQQQIAQLTGWATVAANATTKQSKAVQSTSSALHCMHCSKAKVFSIRNERESERAEIVRELCCSRTEFLIERTQKQCCRRQHCCCRQ